MTEKFVGGEAQVPAVVDVVMVPPAAKDVEIAPLSQVVVPVVIVSVTVEVPSVMVTTGFDAQVVLEFDNALTRVI